MSKPDPLRGSDVDEALAALPEDVAKRLGDNETLERLVYEVFYGGSLAFAKKFLVIAIQRHVLGLTLKTPEEERAEMLASLNEEERAQWWKDFNRTQTALGDDRKAKFS